MEQLNVNTSSNKCKTQLDIYMSKRKWKSSAIFFLLIYNLNNYFEIFLQISMYLNNNPYILFSKQWTWCISQIQANIYSLIYLTCDSSRSNIIPKLLVVDLFRKQTVGVHTSAQFSLVTKSTTQRCCNKVTRKKRHPTTPKSTSWISCSWVRCEATKK